MAVDVKICGVRDAAAIEAAVAGGARFIGLNFYPRSPRIVSVAEAEALGPLVPAGVIKVGLVVDPDDAQIDAVAGTVDLLQLHGKETPERVRAVAERSGKPVMKAIAVAAAEDLARARAYLGSVDRLLFDAKPPKDMVNALPGGNALAFDWDLLAGSDWPVPWMLAGGLDADNLAAAVRRSGARAVDTSSGVEDSPGVKNPDKIRAFLAAAARL